MLRLIQIQSMLVIIVPKMIMFVSDIYSVWNLLMLEFEFQMQKAAAENGSLVIRGEVKHNKQQQEGNMGNPTSS